MGILEEVTKLYEQRPYPPVSWLSPFFHSIRSDDLPLLNYRAAFAACFGSTQGATQNPKILVVGCGTVEPVAVALANPGAQILAVDISQESLRKMHWMARWKGVSSRIKSLHIDLEKIPPSQGPFDFVIGTGVLHHLDDPARALNSLRSHMHENSVIRLMLYSRWGRDLLYGAKEMAQSLGIKSPGSFRRFMNSLPADHPYRIYFHLYEDARTDAGLADGYLHPCDKPFDACALERFLSEAGFEVSLFLHHPEGQPESADRWGQEVKVLRPWAKLALLELYGELNENFIFLANAAGEKKSIQAKSWEWNEALPQRGKLLSKLVGEELEFDREKSPTQFTAIETKLKKALFLLPAGGGE